MGKDTQLLVIANSGFEKIPTLPLNIPVARKSSIFLK
jgi:hypothetical protein